jgi:hypothetical protein
MEPASVAVLDRHSILQAKHSASYSAKGNALDAGNFFKSSKARVKFMGREEVESSTAELRKRLTALMGEKKPHLSSEKRKAMVGAAARVVVASQTSMTRKVVQESFAKTGQFKGSGLDFDAKMACTTYKLSAAEMTTMRTHFEPLTEKMRQQGFIEEAQMDAAGIAKVADGKSKVKSDRSFPKQRAMCINTVANVARYRANPPKSAMSAEEKEKQKEEAKRAKEAKAEAKAIRDEEKMQKAAEKQQKAAEREEKKQQSKRKAEARAAKKVKKEAGEKRKASASSVGSVANEVPKSRAGRKVKARPAFDD